MISNWDICAVYGFCFPVKRICPIIEKNDVDGDLLKI